MSSKYLEDIESRDNLIKDWRILFDEQKNFLNDVQEKYFAVKQAKDDLLRILEKNN